MKKRILSFVVIFCILFSDANILLNNSTVYANSTQTVVKTGTKMIEINLENGKTEGVQDIKIDGVKLIGSPTAVVDSGTVKVEKTDNANGIVTVRVSNGSNKTKSTLTDTIEGWIRLGAKATRYQPTDVWITVPGRKIKSIDPPRLGEDKGNFVEEPRISGFNGKDSTIYMKLDKGKLTKSIYYRDVEFSGKKPINQYVSSEEVSNNEITLYFPYTSTFYMWNNIFKTSLYDDSNSSPYVKLEYSNGLYKDLGKRTLYIEEKKHTVNGKVRMGTSMSPLPEEEIFYDGTDDELLKAGGANEQGYGGAGWDRVEDVEPLNGTQLVANGFTDVGKPYWNRTKIKYKSGTPKYDVRLKLSYDIIEYYPIITYQYEAEVTKYKVTLTYQYEDQIAVPTGKPVALFKMPKEIEMGKEFNIQELSMPQTGQKLIYWHWEVSSNGTDWTFISGWNYAGDRKYSFDSTGTKYIRLRVMQSDTQWSDWYELPIDVYREPLKQPTASIIGKEVVFEDDEEDYYINGRTENEGAIIERAYWESTGGATVVSSDPDNKPKNGHKKLRWANHGVYTISGSVVDSEGEESEVVSKTIKVLKLPHAVLRVLGALKVNRMVILDLNDSVVSKIHSDFAEVIEVTPLTAGVTTNDIKKESVSGHRQRLVFKKPGNYLIRAQITQTGNGKTSDWVEQTIRVVPDDDPFSGLSALPVTNRDYANGNKTVLEIKRTSQSNDSDFLFPKSNEWGQNGEAILYGKFDVDGNGFANDAAITLFDSKIHNADTDYTIGVYTVRYVTAEKIFKVTVNTNRVGDYQFYIYEREAFGQESILAPGFVIDSERRYSTSTPITIKVDNISPMSDFKVKTQPKVDISLNVTGLDLARKTETISKYMAELVDKIRNQGLDTNIELIDKNHSISKLFKLNSSELDLNYPNMTIDGMTVTEAKITVDKVTSKKYLGFKTTGSTASTRRFRVYELLDDNTRVLHTDVYVPDNITQFEFVVDNGNVALGYTILKEKIVMMMYDKATNTWSTPVNKSSGDLGFDFYRYPGMYSSVSSATAKRPEIVLSYKAGTGKAYMMLKLEGWFDPIEYYLITNSGTVTRVTDRLRTALGTDWNKIATNKYATTIMYFKNYDLTQDEAGNYHLILSTITTDSLGTSVKEPGVSYYLTNKNGLRAIKFPFNLEKPNIAYEDNKVFFISAPYSHGGTLYPSKIGAINTLDNTYTSNNFTYPYTYDFHNGHQNYIDIAVNNGKMYVLLPEIYSYGYSGIHGSLAEGGAHPIALNFHLYEYNFASNSLGKYYGNIRLNLTDSSHPYYHVNPKGSNYGIHSTDAGHATTQYLNTEILVTDQSLGIKTNYRYSNSVETDDRSYVYQYEPLLFMVADSQIISDNTSYIKNKTYRDNSKRFSIILSDNNPNDGGMTTSNQLLSEADKKGVKLIFSGKAVFKNAVSSIQNFTTWVNDAAITPLLNSIANHIVGQAKNNDPNSTLILLKGEKIDLQEWFGDIENDIVQPSKPPIESRWKVVHSQIFQNSLGLITFNNQILSQKPTTISDTFQEKVGKFTVTYEVKDNPPGVATFQKWSTFATKDIIINRRPTSLFNVSGGTITDVSWDIDGNAIVKRKVRYRPVDGTVFTEVHDRTTVYIPAGKYYVEQIVWDDLGAESYPYSQIIDSPGAPTNPPTTEQPDPDPVILPKILVEQLGTLKENREFTLDVSKSIKGTYDIDFSKTIFAFTPMSGITRVDSISVSPQFKRVQVKGYGSLKVKIRLYDVTGRFTEQEFTYNIIDDIAQTTNFNVNATAYRDPDNDKMARFTLEDISVSTDDYIDKRKWYYKRELVDADFIQMFDGETDDKQVDFEIPWNGNIEFKLVTTEGFKEAYIQDFITEADYNKAEALKISTVLNRKPSVDFKIYGNIDGQEVEGLSILGRDAVIKFPNNGNEVYEKAGDSKKGFIDQDGDSMQEVEWKILFTSDVDNTTVSKFHNEINVNPVTDFDQAGRYEITFRAKDQYGEWSDPVTRVHFVRRRPNSDFKIVPSIRYIRDTITGNSVNEYNHWTEIQAIDHNGTNRASGKAVTSNNSLSDGSLITDGNFISAQFATGNIGTQYIQIDLGAAYPIEKIKVLHYEDRVYKKHKIEVSSDGSNWVTIYNKDTQEKAGGIEVKTYIDEKTYYRKLDHKIINYSYDPDYQFSRTDYGILSTSRKVKAIGEDSYNGVTDIINLGAGQHEVAQEVKDIDQLTANNANVVAMVTPTIVDIPAKAHAGETITINAKADVNAERLDIKDEYNGTIEQMVQVSEDADYSYWEVTYKIPDTTPDGILNFTTNTILNFGYKFTNLDEVKVETPLEIELQLSPQYPNGIPASESLQIEAKTTSPIDVTNLVVWLEGEGNVNLTKGTRTGNDIAWTGTYNVRSTKTDKDYYTFSARGTLVNGNQKTVQDKVNVKTPIDLVITQLPSTVYCNMAITAKFETSIYANYLRFNLFGNNYFPSATVEGNKKVWTVTFTAPDGSFPQGDYVGTATATTPNGNVEVMTKNVAFAPYSIIDITDVGGKRGEKLKVTITTTPGADKVEVNLPALYQRTIELNEKNYVFGNPSASAKLIGSTGTEMTWQYEFILPWTQTSPPDGIYNIPIKATFNGSVEINDTFSCTVNGYLKYYNPSGVFK